MDTETTGLRAYHEDQLFSVIIHDDEKPYYFNFQAYPDLGEEWILPREWIPFLKPIFANPDSLWFISNAKFDMAMLAKEGVEILGKIHCTEALGRVERNDEIKYGLDALSKKIGLGKSDAVLEYVDKHHLWEWEQIPGKKKRTKKKFFNKVPFGVIVPYAEQDARATLFVGRHQVKTLNEMVAGTPEGLPVIWSVAENEREFTKTCFHIEQSGIRVDQDYCKAAIDYEESRYNRAAGRFTGLTGIPFQDANAVLERAFRAAGETVPVTSLGNPSFTDDVLQKFNSPLAKVVQEYRDAYKKANTYYRNFLYFADKQGRIHSNLKPGGTGTGRISIVEPALQTLADEEDLDLPFKVRRAFIPAPGMFFLMLDYDQMEYRMMLDYAGQMDVIREVLGGMDVHEATAKIIREMLGIQISRSQAKTLNFGFLYGMGIDALAHALGISQESAGALKRAYFQALPFVQGFIRRVTKKAESTGYIFNWAGRRSYFKDLGFCYKACNYLIQGGCGDAVKFAMNKIAKLLSGKKTKMVLQIHDELLFEMCPTEMYLIPEIREIMENVYPYKHLKLTCSVEHSFTSWADKVKGIPT